MPAPKPLPAGTQVSHYKLGREVGRGGFAIVYLGMDQTRGSSCAVKHMAVSRMDEGESAALQAEIDLMKRLSHENIVQYYGSHASTGSLFIMMEYVDQGSILSLIKMFGPLSEQVAAMYTVQILRGLAYLHEQGVVHRDIKGANLLVTGQGTIKLADFGVAVDATDGDMGVAGTPYWLAPEVVEMSGASAASDIWAVGCTVIEMITGEPPYFDLEPMSALFRIVQDPCPPLPPFASSTLRAFLTECFKKTPSFRKTAKELIGEAWIQTNGRAAAQAVAASSIAVDPPSPSSSTGGGGGVGGGGGGIPPVAPPPLPPPSAAAGSVASEGGSEHSDGFWDFDKGVVPAEGASGQAQGGASGGASGSLLTEAMRQRMGAEGGAVVAGGLEAARLLTEEKASALAMGVMYAVDDDDEDSDEQLEILASKTPLPVSPSAAPPGQAGPIAISLEQAKNWSDLQVAAQAMAVRGLVLEHKEAAAAESGADAAHGGLPATPSAVSSGDAAARDGAPLAPGVTLRRKLPKHGTVTKADIDAWQSGAPRPPRPKIRLGPPGFASRTLPRDVGRSSSGGSGGGSGGPGRAAGSSGDDDEVWDFGAGGGDVAAGGAPPSKGPAGGGAADLKAQLAAKLKGKGGAVSAAALRDAFDASTSDSDDARPLAPRPAKPPPAPLAAMADSSSDDDDWRAALSSAKGKAAQVAPTGGTGQTQAAGALAGWADSDSDGGDAEGTRAAPATKTATTPHPPLQPSKSSSSLRVPGFVRCLPQAPSRREAGGLEPALYQQFSTALSTLLGRLEATQVAHDVLVRNMEALFSLLKDKAQMRQACVERRGIPALLALLQAWGASPRATKWILRVLNTLVADEDSRVATVCFVGGLPIILRFTGSTFPAGVRLQAARFIHRVAVGDASNLRVFVGCGGVQALVQLMHATGSDGSAPGSPAHGSTPTAPLIGALQLAGAGGVDTPFVPSGKASDDTLDAEDTSDLLKLNAGMKPLIASSMGEAEYPPSPPGTAQPAATAVQGGLDQALLRVGVHGLLAVVTEESGVVVSHDELRRLLVRAGALPPIVRALRAGFYYACNVLCHALEEGVQAGSGSESDGEEEAPSTPRSPSGEPARKPAVSSALAKWADEDSDSDSLTVPHPLRARTKSSPPRKMQHAPRGPMAAQWTLAPDAFRRHGGGAHATLNAARRKRGGGHRPLEGAAHTPPTKARASGGTPNSTPAAIRRGMSLADRSPSTSPLSSRQVPRGGVTAHSAVTLFSVARHIAQEQASTLRPRSRSLTRPGGRSGRGRTATGTTELDRFAYGAIASGSDDSSSEGEEGGGTLARRPPPRRVGHRRAASANSAVSWAPHTMLDIAVSAGSEAACQGWEVAQDTKNSLMQGSAQVQFLQGSLPKAMSPTTMDQLATLPSVNEGAPPAELARDPWAALPPLPQHVKSMLSSVLRDMRLLLDTVNYLASGGVQLCDAVGTRSVVATLILVMRPAPSALLWHPLYAPLVKHVLHTLRLLVRGEGAQRAITAAEGVEALVTFLARNTGLTQRDAFGIPRAPCPSHVKFTPLQSYMQEQVLNALLLLCLVDRSRRRHAASAGVLLPLRALAFRKGSPLQPFAIMLLTQQAQAGGASHEALWDAGGVDLYLRLLSSTGWESSALQALAAWVAADRTGQVATHLASESTSINSISAVFASSRVVEGLFQPLNTLVTRSPDLAREFANAPPVLSRLSLSIREEMQKQQPQPQVLIDTVSAMAKHAGSTAAIFSAQGLRSSIAAALEVSKQKHLVVMCPKLEALLSALS